MPAVDYWQRSPPFFGFSPIRLFA